jgi:hypothetical protein
MEKESSYFQGSQINRLAKLLVENVVFFLQIDNRLPVPFLINEFLIIHVVAQGSFLNLSRQNQISIESCQKR